MEIRSAKIKDQKPNKSYHRRDKIRIYYKVMKVVLL